MTSAVVILITNSLAVTFSQEWKHFKLKPLLGTAAAADEKTHNIAVLKSERTKTCALTMVFTVQVIGWIGIIAFSFWCTAWLGLQTLLAGTSLSFPMAMLTTQTLIGFVFTFFLPKINRCMPIAWVWILFQLINLGSLCSSRWFGPEKPIATFIVLALGGGPAYIVHITNVQLLSRIVISEQNNIGWVAGLLNNTMTVAQILVGGLSGVFVVCSQPSGGSTIPCPEISEVLFFWTGIGGFVIDLFILALDIFYFEGRIFSTKREINRRESSVLSPSRMSPL